MYAPLIVYTLKFQELDPLSPICHNGNVDNVMEASPSRNSRIQDLPAVNFSPKHDFVDGDDDGLDPAMREELDRLARFSLGRSHSFFICF